MRTITVYESLQELIDAYKSGSLTRERYLVLDFTDGTYFLSGGDAEDEIVLTEERLLDDILEEAFSALEIPVHLT